MTITSAAVRAFLRRLRSALRSGRFYLSEYALERAFDELAWLDEDIVAQIALLQERDFLRSEHSTAREADRIWVFCPYDETEGELWIRLVEREGVVVISFHRA